MLAYVVTLFFVFQYFYKKGELLQKKKRHEQRPIPKITKESLAAFNEKMQVNSWSFRSKFLWFANDTVLLDLLSAPKESFGQN